MKWIYHEQRVKVFLDLAGTSRAAKAELGSQGEMCATLIKLECEARNGGSTSVKDFEKVRIQLG